MEKRTTSDPKAMFTRLDKNIYVTHLVLLYSGVIGFLDFMIYNKGVFICLANQDIRLINN